MIAVTNELPAWLREVTDAPDLAGAVDGVWQRCEGTPVLGERRERDGRTEQQVTFLWRQRRSDVEVLVHVNGVTDAIREDFSAALLEQLPGTNLWHLTWWLPADGTWGYRFVEMPQIPRDAGASHEGWLAIHQAGQLDPLNPAWQPHALGESSSVLVLDGAYQHPAWGPTPSRHQSLAHREITGPDGETRAVHVWSPSAGASATLVLLDGEQWAALGVADAIAAAGLDLELVLVDTIDFPTRSRDLPDPERAATLVAAALAAVGGRDPERVVVAGQSYGGLAAASVVLRRPDLAQTTIAQSSSFWYRAGVPPMRIDLEPGDLTQALAAGELGAPPVRLVLHAGTDEGTMPEQARMLQEAAAAQGIDAQLTVVTGGHDYAWWKHHLLRELEELLTAWA